MEQPEARVRKAINITAGTGRRFNMYPMDRGSSLPSEALKWPRYLSWTRVRRRIGALLGRAEREKASREYREQAARLLLAHAEADSTLFERARRLTEKAERLEREGTPSESAANRAGRAREEVVETLSALRASFAASGREKGRVFDEESRRLFPFLKLPAGS